MNTVNDDSPTLHPTVQRWSLIFRIKISIHLDPSRLTRLSVPELLYAKRTGGLIGNFFQAQRAADNPAHPLAMLPVRYTLRVHSSFAASQIFPSGPCTL